MLWQVLSYILCIIWAHGVKATHVPFLQFLAGNLSHEFELVDNCDATITPAQLEGFRVAINASYRFYGLCYGDDRAGNFNAQTDSCLSPDGGYAVAKRTSNSGTGPCNIYTFLSTYQDQCSEELTTVDRCNNITSKGAERAQPAPSTRNISSDLTPYCPEEWVEQAYHPASSLAVDCMNTRFNPYFACLVANGSNSYCRGTSWPILSQGDTQSVKKIANGVYVVLGILVGLGTAAPILCFFFLSRRRAKRKGATMVSERDIVKKQLEDEKKNLAVVNSNNRNLLAQAEREKQRLIGEKRQLSERPDILERKLREEREKAIVDSAKLTEKLDIAQTKLELAQRDRRNAETTLAAVKADFAAKATNNNTFASDLASAHSALRNTENELARAREAKVVVDNSLLRVQGELNTATARITALTSEKSTATSQLAARGRDLATARQNQTRAENALRTSVNEKTAAEAALATLRGEVTGLREQRDSTLRRCETLAREITTLRESSEAQINVIAENERVIRKNTEDMERLRQRMERLHDMAMNRR